MCLDVEVGDDSTTIACRWLDGQHPPVFALTELLFWVALARIGTRSDVNPTAVITAEPPADQAPFVEALGVSFESGTRHAITFAANDAARPFLTASEAMWETFEPELRRRLAQLDASAPLADKVRAVLLESLPSGESAIQVTARRLGLSSRTLQRNLKAEGTSYKEVVSRTREQLARHYVTNTKLPYAEIGLLIGFEEPSSFFRAFRGWTGETPHSARFPVAEQPSNLPAFWDTP